MPGIDPISTGIGLVGGLVGGIGKIIGRGKANRQLEQLLKQDPRYQINPLAQQRLGLAQTLLNARQPGAATAERNIYSNEANQLAFLNRNATDASQALALAGSIAGQTNQAFENLGMQEAQDYQRRYGNLTEAQQGMISEGDKQYQDQIRRYQDLLSIRGAQNENRQNTWGDIANFGFGLIDFGMSGGFGGRGGRGTGSTTQRGYGNTGGIPFGTPTERANYLF